MTLHMVSVVRAVGELAGADTTFNVISCVFSPVVMEVG